VQQTFSEPGGEWSVWPSVKLWRYDKSVRWVQRYFGWGFLLRGFVVGVMERKVMLMEIMEFVYPYSVMIIDTYR
jgi:hypothetical protein